MAADPQVIEASRAVVKTAAPYLIAAMVIGTILGLVVRYLSHKTDELADRLRNKLRKK